MENKGAVKISQVLKEIFMERLAAFLIWVDHGQWLRKVQHTRLLTWPLQSCEFTLKKSFSVQQIIVVHEKHCSIYIEKSVPVLSVPSVFPNWTPPWWGSRTLHNPPSSCPFPGTAFHGHLIPDTGRNCFKHSLTATEDVCKPSFIMTSHLMLRRVKQRRNCFPNSLSPTWKRTLIQH